MVRIGSWYAAPSGMSSCTVAEFPPGLSGRIIGKDEGLPRILAVDGGRVAVEAEESVPTVIVYSVIVHTPPSGR